MVVGRLSAHASGSVIGHPTFLVIPAPNAYLTKNVAIAQISTFNNQVHVANYQGHCMRNPRNNLICGNQNSNLRLRNGIYCIKFKP